MTVDGSSEESLLMVEARGHERKLLNFFARQGVSTFEAEDLVQETYLRLWKYREEYQPTAQLTTFLFLMARQVRIDALRRQERRTAREKSWGAYQPTEAAAASVGAREDVRWALSRLPEPQRDVVEFGVLQDLPYAEVGKILGIPVGTVKSRMSTALKKLKEVLDECGS